MATLSVIILTFNEELHIERAIKSVASIAEEIFVVDSGSTDQTASKATALGAKVLTNPWVNYAQQFQWALDNISIKSDWIMRLDADEVVETDLANKLLGTLESSPSDVSGINLKLKRFFMGRRIAHGGCSYLTLLRIWRRGAARIEQRWMDEHIVLEWGKTVTIRGGFRDHNLNDLSFFTEKHNRYASREAIDILNQRYSLFEPAVPGGHPETPSSRAAALKRWAKNTVYNRLPIWFGPPVYFFFRYVLQLGFLDGVEGLIYHGLQGGWYRFLVASKVHEWDRRIRSFPEVSDKVAALSEISGYKLQ